MLARGWYVVTRNFVLLLLKLSAWHCLTFVYQDLHTFWPVSISLFCAKAVDLKQINKLDESLDPIDPFYRMTWAQV